MTAQRRHQVTDIAPVLPPKVTEYVAQAKECPGCGTVTEGDLPAHVRARASFGPETCAQAANLTAGAPHPGLPVHAAAVPARRDRRINGVDGRDPGPRRRAGGGQQVHGPGPGAAEDRPGSARG